MRKPFTPEDAEEERLKILGQVGNCLSKWSLVEQQICLLFGLIMATNFVAATAAFSSVTSLDGRLKMLDAAIEGTHPKNQAFSDAWNAAFNRLSRLNKKRNEVAHFTLANRKGWPTLTPFYSLDKPILAVLNGQPGDGFTKHLSSKQLQARADAFDAAGKTVSMLASYWIWSQGKIPATAAPGGDPARWLQRPTARCRAKT